jgi:hypothetical protein
VSEGEGIARLHPPITLKDNTMTNENDRVLGRILAVEELNTVSGAKTFPEQDTAISIDSGATADSGTTSDSGTSADSGTMADSGTTADSGTVSDSGTSADTSPNPIARDAPDYF